MSVARVFTPKNRLHSVLMDPYASTAADLVAAAERNVAKLKPNLQAAVERHLADFMRVADRSEQAADSEALGAAAAGIAELAAACDMAAVGEAARGAYAMLTAQRKAGVWRAEAFSAHVNALRLLASKPRPKETETREILDRLAGVRAFIGVPT